MARYPRCIFCDSQKSPPSTEDVLARWIAREFPGREKSKFRVTMGHDLSKPDRVFHTRGHLGLVTRKQCEACNNGWMSRLEQAVQPIMRPLIAGTPTKVPTVNQHTIAAWMVKTAMTYEFAKERSPRYFKPVDRASFYKHRTIPSDTFVFMGRYVGTHSLWGTDADLRLTLSPETRTATDMDAYTVTFVINQLAIQLFSFRRPKDFRRPIGIKLPGPWETAQCKIWPLWRECDWPPEFAFDDEGIGKFAQRWDNVIP